MSATKPIHVGPDMSIHHPVYGDMTAEVAAELTKLNQAEEDEAYRNAHARQAEIAKTCGTDARLMDKNSGLRLVAQIDASVFSYWEAREGKDFWSYKGELKRMLKKHPELAVKTKSNQFSFATTAPEARRGRGRWATA